MRILRADALFLAALWTAAPVSAQAPAGAIPNWAAPADVESRTTRAAE